jgi:hypothetical protein
MVGIFFRRDSPALGVAKRFLWKAIRISNRYAINRGEFFASLDTEILERHPPIFLVGPPRVGSTVLMQLLTQHLDVRYLGNYHKIFFGWPRLGDLLFRKQPGPRGELVSNLGTTPGLYGPWEGGDWWYRFFPRIPNYVDEVTERQVDRGSLLRSVANWTAGTHRSIVFKNLYASLRIRVLASTFPNARYIHLEREESANAASILQARKTVFQSTSVWWSLRPAGWESVTSEDPLTQVLFQIRETHRTIAEDLELSGIPSSFIHKVSYEEICESPGDVLDRIELFLSAAGVVRR